MYIFLKLNKTIIIIIIICFSLGRKVCLQVFRYNESFPTWFQGKYSSNFFSICNYLKALYHAILLWIFLKMLKLYQLNSENSKDFGAVLLFETSYIFRHDGSVRPDEVWYCSTGAFRVWKTRGYSTNVYAGRLRPEVQPHTLLYVIFHEKGTPFVQNNLSSLSAVHQTLVTYSFVRNSQTSTTHPSPLPAHSVATPET